MPVKSKLKISQNFVALSEYMNFITTHTTMGWNSLWWSIHNFLQSHCHKIIMKRSCYLWNRRKIFVKSQVYILKQKKFLQKLFLPIVTHISYWQTDMIFNDVVYSFYHGLENSIFKIWFEMLLVPSYHR